MSEFTDLLERARDRFPAPEMPVERVIVRRERYVRNQRIAAGVVGIAVFVAAIWIVTSVGSLDRSEKSVVPAGTGPVQTGPAETGPVEAGPMQTAPPPASTSAPPNVTKHHCSDGARSRLEFTDIGDRIEVRFEVHDSPPGHLWHIRMWRNRTITPDRRVEWWRGARVASDGGDFAVVRLTGDNWLLARVKAIDSTTGEVCDVGALIHQ
jgi:hypothetical protein